MPVGLKYLYEIEVFKKTGTHAGTGYILCHSHAYKNRAVAPHYRERARARVRARLFVIQ